MIQKRLDMLRQQSLVLLLSLCSSIVFMQSCSTNPVSTVLRVVGPSGTITGSAWLTKGSGDSTILRGVEVTLCREEAREKQGVVEAIVKDFSNYAMPQFVNLGLFREVDKAIDAVVSPYAITTAKANVDGKFSFSDVRDGNYMLFARFESSNYFAAWLEPVTVHAGQNTTFDLDNSSAHVFNISDSTSGLGVLSLLNSWERRFINKGAPRAAKLDNAENAFGDKSEERERLDSESTRKRDRFSGSVTDQTNEHNQLEGGGIFGTPKLPGKTIDLQNSEKTNLELEALRQRNSELAEQVGVLRNAENNSQIQKAKLEQKITQTELLLSQKASEVKRLENSLDITQEVVIDKEKDIAKLLKTVQAYKIVNNQSVNEPRSTTQIASEPVEPVIWSNVREFYPALYKSDIATRLDRVNPPKITSPAHVCFSIQKDGQPVSITVGNGKRDFDQTKAIRDFVQSAGPFRPLLSKDLRNISVDFDFDNRSNNGSINQLEISALGNRL